MIQDELAGLSVLLMVAEKRSFTAAAAELRVTPSAVSQTVSALEARVGVRLLQRSTRKVGLTEAGERFLSRVRPAVEEVRSALSSLDDARARPGGTLRLSVSRVASRALIEPVLARFLAAYPELRLDVAFDEGLTPIIEQGFDAGIRLGETLERDMVAVRLGEKQRAAVVGSAGYFAERGTPKHPRDLLEHECINYRMVTSRRLYEWEFTEAGKDFRIGVNGRLVCNDADLMLRAARDGVGIAYALESLVREELASGTLVRVLERYCEPFPGYYLYYPSRAHVAPKLRALIDFLKSEHRTRRGKPRRK